MMIYVLQKLAAPGDDEFSRSVVRWKSSGSGDDLREVLKHLRPIIAQRSHDYPQVGPEITKAELTRAALKGLRKYESGRASAKTWAITSMKAASRPLLRRATPLRIPDSRLQAVGRFKRSQEEGGTIGQQARRAGMSSKEMLLLQREHKPVFLSSREEVPHGQKASRYKEVWGLLKHELSDNEKRVHSMLSSDPNAKTSDIAKSMGVSASSVSYYKKRIKEKANYFSRSRG